MNTDVPNRDGQCLYSYACPLPRVPGHPYCVPHGREIEFFGLGGGAQSLKKLPPGVDTGHQVTHKGSA